MCRAHSALVYATLIRERLPIVIALLLYAECVDCDGAARCGGKVAYALTGFGGEAEVLSDDGRGHRTITPDGVGDGVEGVLVVGTPLGVVEGCVAAQDDRVDNGMDK